MRVERGYFAYENDPIISVGLVEEFVCALDAVQHGFNLDGDLCEVFKNDL